MDDPPDPSIEATRTESQNLNVGSHLEDQPDWAFNCRWEDWAASGSSNEPKEGHGKPSAAKRPSSEKPSLKNRVGSDDSEVSTFLAPTNESKKISTETKYGSQNP